MDDAIAILNQHYAHLTDEDEVDIGFSLGFARDDVDLASLALRTCQCGVRVDGFYEYLDHLKAMLRKETH